MMQFKKFVAEKGFAFLEEDRVLFNEFKEKISLLDDETKEALDILQNKLDSRETWQFDTHFSEIRSVLLEEILLRSKGEKSLYEEIWLKEHAEIKQAREILTDTRKYLSILASR